MKILRYFILLIPIVPLIWLILEKPAYRTYSLIGLLINLSVAIWILPKWQVSQFENSQNSMEYAQLLDNSRKTIAQIIGGMLLLFSLHTTWQTIILSQKSLNLSRESQTQKIFTQAVQDLTAINQNNEVSIIHRISAIFTLEQIAVSDNKYYHLICKILSAYIRENSHLNEINTREDFQTILFSLKRIFNSSNRLIYILYDFHEANLCNSNFAGHMVNHGNFSRTNFYGSVLEDTQFVYTDLSYANFSNASLGLKKNHIRSSIDSMVASGTDFTYDNLANANFENAYLVGTSFSVVNLEKTNFKNAIFNNVEFNHCDLTDTSGLTCEQLSQAILCDTKLPSYLLKCSLSISKECMKSE